MSMRTACVSQTWAGATVVGLIAVQGLFFGVARAEEPRPERKQCWTIPLTGMRGDDEIRQNFDGAYIKLPSERAKMMDVPEKWRGVIRRVELPKGVRKIALTFD